MGSPALWQELVAGFPDSTEIARIAVRLIVAVVFGGILGLERCTCTSQRECEPTCS